MQLVVDQGYFYAYDRRVIILKKMLGVLDYSAFITEKYYSTVWYFFEVLTRFCLNILNRKNFIYLF